MQTTATGWRGAFGAAAGATGALRSPRACYSGARGLPVPVRCGGCGGWGGCVSGAVRTAAGPASP